MTRQLAIAAILALTACAPTTGRETPELARHGSISRSTGAEVPLSLCQRGMRVAQAAAGYGGLGSLGRLGYVCGAARGL